MKSNPLALLLIVGGVLFLGAQYIPWTNLDPTKPDGPDMVAAFGPHGKKDAAAFASLCHSLHDYLKSDWEQEGYVKSGAEVDNLRVIARKIRYDGRSLSETYPTLPKVMEQHFENYVGKSGGPLDEAQKTKWLSAWKQLAECSDYAAKRL